MTHLKIELSTNGIEEVLPNVISTLYNLVYSGTLDSSSNLQGRLNTTGTYLNYITYLLELFNGTNGKGPLYITANNVYILFEDSEVLRVLINAWGDGIGLTMPMVNANTIIGTLFKSNKTITTFNELGLFKTIKTIEQLAFYRCSNLTSIDLSNVESIRGTAFFGCSSLTSIDLSSATILGTQAFVDCTSLKTVNFGSTLKVAYSGAGYLYSSWGGGTYIDTLIADFSEWTIYDPKVIPPYHDKMIDIAYFPNVTTLSTVGSYYSGGYSFLTKSTYYSNNPKYIDAIYFPKLQLLGDNRVSSGSSGGRLLGGVFGILPLSYAENHRRYVRIIYLKDITTIPVCAFNGTYCDILVINNSTPPTYLVETYSTFDEYLVRSYNVDVDSWGNMWDHNDPTATIVPDPGIGTATTRNRHALGKTFVQLHITKIYVPNPATYAATTGWDKLPNTVTLEDISTLSKVATRAEWDALSDNNKKVTLIEEYM